MLNAMQLQEQIDALKKTIKVKFYDEKVLKEHFNKMDDTTLDLALTTFKDMIGLKNELFYLQEDDLTEEEKKEFHADIIPLYEQLNAVRDVMIERKGR